MKYQVEVGVGAAVVVLGSGVVAVVVVAVQLAHERLVPQDSWGIEQMEVVTVDRHELPSEITIGRAVGGAVVVAVSVGRSVGGVVVVIVED